MGCDIAFKLGGDAIAAPATKPHNSKTTNLVVLILNFA
jgi:hypothetical protein